MGLIRESYDNEADWLLRRREMGIGGSEAATVAGINPYESRELLLDFKLIRKEPKDLSNNRSVIRGKKFEPVIREVFQTKHSNMKMEYHPYDILYQEDRPWLFATLDGEITKGKKRGIFEAKTADLYPPQKIELWNGRVPNHYYTQILHQFLATGYDFAYLVAFLFKGSDEIIVREYVFKRSECLDDMQWLLKQEEEFMEKLQEEKSDENEKGGRNPHEQKGDV